jgi:hypothetical protein
MCPRTMCPQAKISDVAALLQSDPNLTHQKVSLSKCNRTHRSGLHYLRDASSKEKIVQGTKYTGDTKSQTDHPGAHCSGIQHPVIVFCLTAGQGGRNGQMGIRHTPFWYLSFTDHSFFLLITNLFMASLGRVPKHKPATQISDQ